MSALCDVLCLLFVGQEARSVAFVGERLAEKIFEIVSTGKLRRLEHVDKEKERVVDMFKNIHGVGQVTAQQFYAQVWYPCLCACNDLCLQLLKLRAGVCGT